jgi:hypothetical protein
MPTAVLLVLACIGAWNTTFTGGKNVVTMVKTIHHHTTRPVYRHVIKPTAKAVKKAVAQ